MSDKTCHHNGLFRPQWLALIALIAALFFTASALAQVMGSASLHTERRGHTATLLQDGTVLIVGGENPNGIVSQAEILNPASLSSAPVAAAGPARTDHAASLLQDGRVLVSGGRVEAGELASTQIYDPATGEFLTGPSMMRPRSGHTATRLSDGKILMTGGDPSGSAEIYDPATDSFSLVIGSLTTARRYHSAIRLHNGQVLVVGGVDAQNTILNTAEIFEPDLQGFYPPLNALEIPRALATLRILPDGKVQVIGGDSDFSMEIFDPELANFNAVAYLPPAPEYLGATLSTRSRAALVSPSASQNPNMLGIPLSAELLDLLDRADHTITELPSRNQALVAGGVNSAGQVLSSATVVQSSPASITTDYTDYAPGEFVIITGTGFMPNEDIVMIMHERPDEYPARLTFEATADSQGNYMYGQFAPQIIDLNRTFTLTATGLTSGFTAQTVFTDANAFDVTPETQTVEAGSVNNLSWTFTATNSANQATSTFTIPPEWPAPGPGQVTVTGCTSGFTIGGADGRVITITQSGNGGGGRCGSSQSLTISYLNVTAPNPASTPQTYTFDFQHSQDPTVTVVAPVAAATSLNVSMATGTYGGTVDLSAILTRSSDSTPVSDKIISFTLNGNHVGTAVTNGSGVAVLNNVNLSGIGAGSYPAGIGASFTGDSGFVASNGTNSLTIQKATPTATLAVSNSPQTYSGSAQAATVTITTSSVPGTVDNILTGGAATQTNAGTYAVTADFVPTDTANYNSLIGLSAGNFVIDKAATTTTVTCTAGPFTYNGSAHTPCSASVTGPGGLNESLTVTYLNNVNAGTATASASYAETANYMGSSNSANFTIDKASQEITVVQSAAASAMYNTTFDVQATGGASGNPVVISVSGVCETVSGGEHSATILMTSGHGICTVQFKQVGNHNYHDAPLVTQETFAIAWDLYGFYKPVDMTPATATALVWNTIKGGSTVPLKFKIFAELTEQTSTSAVKLVTVQAGTCTAGFESEIDPTDLTATGGTSLRYDTTGGQFIFNWQTDRPANRCYRVTMTTQDNSQLSAYFKTK